MQLQLMARSRRDLIGEVPMPLARSALIALRFSLSRRWLSAIESKLLSCRAFLDGNIQCAKADPGLEERLREACTADSQQVRATRISRRPYIREEEAQAGFWSKSSIPLRILVLPLATDFVAKVGQGLAALLKTWRRAKTPAPSRLLQQNRP